ncbi:MAG TPA: RHS repeat-associated core domain-containing protein, partial [Ktedonobacterales bacterium]|nr:RHS repeat-associated core domain-containing protein [Ktedonobacterales bacterium]
QISYDQQGYATGESAGLIAGLPTRVDQWANCGTSGNGYASSGVVTTGTGYDAHGQPIVTTDADALAGISGHTGCTAPVTPLVVYPTGASSYTSCTQYDSVQNVYPTSASNALFTAGSTTYDVAQGVATSSTDANGVITSYGGPVYEYSGSPSLATFQDVYTQTTLPGETLGGSAPWTTRVFAYSFCAGATGSSTSPCLEVDTVRQSDASDTLVSRAFYDRDGREVETRTTSPVSGQDTVTISAYNDVNHSTWTSLDCTTPTLTATNGGRAVGSTPNYYAPTQTTLGSSAWVNPAVGGTSCSSGTLTGTTTWYDALNRVVATDDPLGTGVGASGTGCLLAGGTVHHTDCVVYAIVVGSQTPGLPSNDGEPYLQAVTIDANLHQQASYTDGLGRVAYTQELSGASQQAFGSGISSYAVTTNYYDPTGALYQIKDPLGQFTTLVRDALGRQTALLDPNRGHESYSYDPNGNLTYYNDARGWAPLYAGYDGLNRQLWRNTTNSPSGAYVTYTYDSKASGNDGVGRLTSEPFSNSNSGGAMSGSYAFTYDARGRMTATVETVDGTPYTTSATYNDLDQLVSQTYPNGDVVTSDYNGATGQESALSLLQSGASGAVGLLTNETYSGQAGAAGLLTVATLSAFTSGSGAYSASYDGLLRLTTSAYTYTPSSGSPTMLYQAQPTYDAVGNVTSQTTTLPQGTDTQAFCYDAQNRLIWAGSSGTAPCGNSVTPGETGSLAGTGASYSASYTYDALNRLTSSPLGSYTYGDSAHEDAATAVGSAWSASYDEAGNLTCRAATSGASCAGATPTGAQLGWNDEGQLYGWQNAFTNPTQSASYLYDGEGQRVAEVTSVSGGATTTTAFIGGLEAVTSSGGTTTTTAYYGGGLAESVNGTLSYLLSDPTLGSASASVATSTGLVTASQLYSPYGSMRYQSGILPTDYGFTHQRADATTGLDDYGARYYDPVAGQFTSADTTLAGGLNRYAYVAGNPETRTDPSGHVYAQRTTPYYQNFGAAVYSLIAQDKGKATNGMSTALFIARYDPDAYRSAEAFATAHGVIMMPHVGEDANTYVQTR